MKKIIEIISVVLVTVAVIIITAFLFGLPISWLWNLFCPKVFGWPTIDWIDGTVLYALSKALFWSNNSSN